MRLLLSLILIASIASACLPGALADESGPGFSFILQSNENLEISGAARIKGDTYSRGNTQVFGSAAIDGRGYASGSVSFDSPDLPYTGMVYSNAGVQEFPNIDFNHYKSLAQSTGKVFTNNLHLTKANPMAGVIFVEGNLKISGGIHRISAFVTGDIKVSGQSNLSSNTDGHLLAAAGPIEISGAPAIDGVVYSRDASITITGGPSLKGAVAAKRDLKVSGNISAQDTIAPAGPVLDQPPNFSATSTTKISGRAEAHSQLELIEGAVVLGSAVVDAVGNFSLSLNLAEGPHTLIAVAQDSAGNVSEPSAPVNTTVDLTPPYVTLAAPSLLEPLKGTPTLEASATDNFEVAKVQFFLDDELIGTDTSYPYQTPLDTAVYANGTHTLKLVAYDGAGNSGQSETEVQIANNVVTPFGGEITSPDGLVTLNFAPGSVSEPVEIVYSSIPSQAPPGFSLAGPFFDLSARTLGGRDVSWFFQPFTVSVNSISDAPNQSLYFLNSQTGSWEMIKPSTVFQGRLTAQLDHFTLFGVLSDTQSPTTSASPSTEAAPSGWRLTDTAVTLAATDTGSGVERISYQFDSTSPLWQTYTAPIAVPEGEHTLYFYGEDKAGNGEELQSQRVKVDKAPPVIIMTSPLETTLTEDRVSIGGLIQDNLGVDSFGLKIQRGDDMYWDGANWAAEPIDLAPLIFGPLTNPVFNYLWELPKDDGSIRYEIEAWATDPARAGLDPQIQTLAVKIDNLVPAGSVILGDGGPYTRETTLTLRSDITSADQMRLSFDGKVTWGDWEAVESTKTLTLAPGEGTRTVDVEFKRSSNQKVLSVGKTIVLDTQAPEVGITAPVQGNNVQGLVSVSGFAQDGGAGIESAVLYVNDEPIFESSASPFLFLWDTTKEINGLSTLVVVAKDKVGNATQSQAVQVEVENPIVTTPAQGVKDWLIIGPHINPDQVSRLSRDYLGGENLAKPSTTDSSVTALHSETEAIDFSAYLTDTGSAAAYGNVYIHSLLGQRAKLFVGSTDAYKAWLNGEVTAEKSVQRTYAPDQESYDIKLRDGWNQLLIKSANAGPADFKFSAKIAYEDRSEVPNLSYQLQSPFSPVLFEDNFNESTTALSGRWQSQGALVLSGKLKNQGFFISQEAVDEQQGDYLISQELMFYPNRTNTLASFVLFRALDPQNGYELGFTERGHIAFCKKIAGQRSQIGPSVDVLLEQGKFFDLKIRVKDNAFSAVLDNVTILYATDYDNTFPGPGKVGAENPEYVYVDNLKVEPLGMEPLVIEGQAQDQRGEPIPNLSILASSEPDQDANVLEFSGITASDGSYRIEISDITKTLDLSVLADDQQHSAVTQGAELSAQTREKTVDFTLPDTGAITARVTDTSGVPVTAAAVSAYSPDFLTSAEAIRTDPEGVFILKNLNAPGSYFLFADAYGFSEKTVEATYTVLPNVSQSIQDITLTPAGRISGRVIDPYGNPVSDAFILAKLPGDEESEKVTTTAADGAYLLEDLDAPGTYEVEASAEGFEVALKENIAVMPGALVPDVDFALGITPAYVSEQDSEPNRFVPNPVGGVDLVKDTHQWMTRKGIDILFNDDVLDSYTAAATKTNELFNWEWIARGARIADKAYMKRGGYGRTHFHNWQTHSGGLLKDQNNELSASTSSAADYAQTSFNKALCAWKKGDKQAAMLLLGNALHMVQDLRVPQHNENFMPNHLEYEDFVNDNKSETSVSAGGIYKFDMYAAFHPFEGHVVDHQNPKTAYGWVDRSAHVSINWRGFAINEELWVETQPLVKSAQRFSAGFINFFFEQAGEALPSKPTDRQPWVDDSPEKTNWLFWWDKDNDNFRDAGEETMHNYYDHWNRQTPPMQYNGNCDPHNSTQHENYVKAVVWLWNLRNKRLPDQRHLWPWVTSDGNVYVRNLLTGQDMVSANQLGLTIRNVRLTGKYDPSYRSPYDVDKRVLTNINLSPIYQEGFNADGVYTKKLNEAMKDVWWDHKQSCD